MTCCECGQEMDALEGSYPYVESGLKDILLMNIPMYKCPACKDSAVEIPRLDELHSLIGAFLALQPMPLRGDQARYLRKNLGYTQDELAEKMGVTRITVTRWEEDGKRMKLDHDKHLRRFYLDKKREDLMSHPGILTALAENVPIQTKKQTLRFRKEDWTHPLLQTA